MKTLIISLVASLALVCHRTGTPIQSQQHPYLPVVYDVGETVIDCAPEVAQEVTQLCEVVISPRVAKRAQSVTVKAERPSIEVWHCYEPRRLLQGSGTVRECGLERL